MIAAIEWKFWPQNITNLGHFASLLPLLILLPAFRRPPLRRRSPGCRGRCCTESTLRPSCPPTRRRCTLRCWPTRERERERDGNVKQRRDRKYQSQNGLKTKERRIIPIPIVRKTARNLHLPTWRFIYPSTETRYPLYSMPHLSLTMTGFPVSPLRKGFGFKGMNGWAAAILFVLGWVVSLWVKSGMKSGG